MPLGGLQVISAAIEDPLLLKEVRCINNPYIGRSVPKGIFQIANWIRGQNQRISSQRNRSSWVHARMHPGNPEIKLAPMGGLHLGQYTCRNKFV